MKETVLMGNPGAGKTLLLCGMCQNLDQGVFVDGQVEVPTLWRFFEGEEKTREAFKVLVPLRNFMLCASCGLCAKNCPFGAIYEEDLWIDPLECEGCGVCARNCPQRALEMANMQVGEWIKKEDGTKVLLYGRLLPGALGAPLLAERLREEARKHQAPIIIEAPGLGETAWRLAEGADQVVLVLSPDEAPEALERLKDLIGGQKVGLVLNRTGRHPEEEEKILAQAQEMGIEVLGQIEERPELENLEKLDLKSLTEILSRLVSVAKG